MLRKIAKKILPPSLYNGAKRALGMPIYETEAAGQKGSEYYDKTFDADEYWRRHYTEVRDYASWTVIIDRLRAWPVRSILEIGCGSGLLAAAMRDAGVFESYCGFDFSSHRLSHAHSICPDLRFEHADAFATDLYDTVDYDCVVTTEFLEHVEGDLAVISRLKPRTKLIGIVPNMPWVSHVRYFKDSDEVVARYGPFLDDLTATPLLLDQKGNTNFIMQGIRNRRDYVER